jgi:hypothetical protein
MDSAGLAETSGRKSALIWEVEVGERWRAVECREVGNGKGRRRLELVNHLNGN